MGPIYLHDLIMYLEASVGVSSAAGNLMETSSESSITRVAGKILQQPASSIFLMAAASELYLSDLSIISLGSVGLTMPLLTYGIQKIANIGNLPKLEKLFSALDKVWMIAAKIMSCVIMIFGCGLSMHLSSPLSILFIALFALNAKQLISYFHSPKPQVNS